MYEVYLQSTALGVQHCFRGPGMPMYANGVHLLQPLNAWAAECYDKDVIEGRNWSDREAETISRMLGAAFEAGRQDAKREIRDVLGVHK